MRPRSFLYVPGDRPDRIDKAMASGADAVLVDLEDAVAPAAKAAARRNVVEWLARVPATSPQRWVRVNAGPAGRDDLEALAEVFGTLDGLVLAKCEAVDWLDEVAGRVPAEVALAPLVESARSVRAVDALCGHPRVAQCHLGELDLAADLHAGSGGVDVLVHHARVEVVYASSAAGIAPPIGGVHPALNDPDGLSSTNRLLADLGFGGRPAIHPAQVASINEAFTPTAAEVIEARRVLAALDEAQQLGVGAVADRGQMLDEAVARHARNVVARAQRADMT